MLSPTSHSPDRARGSPTNVHSTPAASNAGLAGRGMNWFTLGVLGEKIAPIAAGYCHALRSTGRAPRFVSRLPSEPSRRRRRWAP